MAIRAGRLGNIAFKKEDAYGSYNAGDAMWRASSESLENKIENVEDNALIGELYPTEFIPVKEGVEGSLEGSFHGDTAGLILHGILGTDVTADANTAYLLISYSGAATYERISCTGSALIAETSTNGTTWGADTAFCSTGTMDLTTGAFDTVGEVATAIAAYTGFDAIAFGPTGTLTSTIAAFAAVNLITNDVKVGGKLIPVVGTASTLAKTHNLSPAAASVSLPSYTFTINRVLGTNKSVGVIGSKFKSVAISNAAGDLCKVNVAVDAQQELQDQNDVSVSVPNIQAFTCLNMKAVIEDATGALTELDELKDFSLTINANLDSNWVIGSKYKKEQDRQKSTIEFSCTANNTATSYPLRTNYLNSTACSLYVYWKSNTYADVSKSVPYSVMVRIPAFKFNSAPSTLSTPDRMTIKFGGSAEKPTNATYTNHIYVSVVDADTTTY